MLGQYLNVDEEAQLLAEQDAAAAAQNQPPPATEEPIAAPPPTDPAAAPAQTTGTAAQDVATAEIPPEIASAGTASNDTPVAAEGSEYLYTEEQPLGPQAEAPIPTPDAAPAPTADWMSGPGGGIASQSAPLTPAAGSTKYSNASPESTRQVYGSKAPARTNNGNTIIQRPGEVIGGPPDTSAVVDAQQISDAIAGFSSPARPEDDWHNYDIPPPSGSQSVDASRKTGQDAPPLMPTDLAGQDWWNTNYDPNLQVLGGGNDPNAIGAPPGGTVPPLNIALPTPGGVGNDFINITGDYLNQLGWDVNKRAANIHNLDPGDVAPAVAAGIQGAANVVQGTGERLGAAKDQDYQEPPPGTVTSLDKGMLWLPWGRFGGAAPETTFIEEAAGATKLPQQIIEGGLKINPATGAIDVAPSPWGGKTFGGYRPPEGGYRMKPAGSVEGPAVSDMFLGEGGPVSYQTPGGKRVWGGRPPEGWKAPEPSPNGRATDIAESQTTLVDVDGNPVVERPPVSRDIPGGEVPESGTATRPPSSRDIAGGERPPRSTADRPPSSRDIPGGEVPPEGTATRPPSSRDIAGGERPPRSSASRPPANRDVSGGEIPPEGTATRQPSSRDIAGGERPPRSTAKRAPSSRDIAGGERPPEGTATRPPSSRDIAGGERPPRSTADRPPSSRDIAGGERPPKSSASRAPSSRDIEGGERPPRSTADRPPSSRDIEGGERPPKSSAKRPPSNRDIAGGEQPRWSTAKRPPSSRDIEGGERPPRSTADRPPSSRDVAGGERPPRSTADRPPSSRDIAGGERPPRSTTDRPPSSRDIAGGERPPRSTADRPPASRDIAGGERPPKSSAKRPPSSRDIAGGERPPKSSATRPPASRDIEGGEASPRITIDENGNIRFADEQPSGWKSGKAEDILKNEKLTDEAVRPPAEGEEILDKAGTGKAGKTKGDATGFGKLGEAIDKIPVVGKLKKPAIIGGALVAAAKVNQAMHSGDTKPDAAAGEEGTGPQVNPSNPDGSKNKNVTCTAQDADNLDSYTECHNKNGESYDPSSGQTFEEWLAQQKGGGGGGGGGGGKGAGAGGTALYPDAPSGGSGGGSGGYTSGKSYTSGRSYSSGGGSSYRGKKKKKKKGMSGGASGGMWPGFPFNRPNSPIRQHVLDAIAMSLAKNKGK